MNSTTKGIVTILAIGIVGFVVYKKFIKPDSRKVVKNYLYSIYGYDKIREDFVNNADKDYVDAWSDAVMKGKDTFFRQGKVYETKTGTVKK